MGGAPVRLVALEQATNLRDLGGYPAAGGGATRWGTVYRSDSLHLLTEGDQARLTSLGVRVVYDLRGEAERRLRPSRLPDDGSVRAVGLPLATTRPGRLELAGHGDDGEAVLLATYRRLLADAAPAIGQLLTALAQPGDLPALFHCAAGKDRTGLAAALVLEAVGVGRDDVLDDYELSASCWDRSRASAATTALADEGASPELIAGLLGAPRWVLATALAELDEAHGGVPGYLRDVAGVGEGTLAALRAALVT